MTSSNHPAQDELQKQITSYVFVHSFIRLIYVLFIFICAITLVACYSKKKSDTKIFHYNEQTGIASLDPAFAKNQSIMWPVHQLFNTLVALDDSLRIIPSLAKSWEVSSDRLTYLFHLRDDVFFPRRCMFSWRQRKEAECKWCCLQPFTNHRYSRGESWCLDFQ